MDPAQNGRNWTTVDKDLNRVSHLEMATQYAARPLVGVGASLVFIVFGGLLAAYFVGISPGFMVVVAAAAVGAYMALNIGANDVANNMGPAVGANALSMAGAIARVLLRGVLEPRRLASTFLMPASSSTVRMEPPAITPVPGAAGRIRTLAAPSRPLLRVGIEE